MQISEDPLMYLLDTPGILSPATNDPQTALQLALCGIRESASANSSFFPGTNCKIRIPPPFFSTMTSGLIHSAGSSIFTMMPSASMRSSSSRKGTCLAYVDYLGLDEPCEDIRLVLYKTALNMRAVNKVRTYEGWSLRPNQEAAAVNLIQGFRRGLLGRITFLPDSGNSMLDAARQPSAA
ncbi:mitochondrial ribosome-associated GTPase 1-like [Rhipicephalus sanguineus]|uniref:mitochondrial ribosome-associated GTPase 1-like n=1 Tax=Rhipicephalus sanguineus TaxID=34632 RepID=UPI0020C3730F|nr:mitochondrial ribosome-associated GTPase 1-like [Rhipicephalus sanguineus]